MTMTGLRPVKVNMVHFEDVKVPAGNLIGEEGKGWTYANIFGV